MKKNSVVFKALCFALAAALCFSVINVFAEDADVAEVTDEVIEDVTEVQEEESLPEVDVEVEEDVTEDETVSEEEETEIAEETMPEEESIPEEEEVIDLEAAALRDNGVYITPGDTNDATFNYDGMRYRVRANTGNSIKLDGFETNVDIKNDPINSDAKGVLQANGRLTREAAHSGYYGLSISTGDVVYRTGVSGDQVYVFSAWVNMPSPTCITDYDRNFRVKGDNGSEYVVGVNEVARDTDTTGSWQQILFTFKAPTDGLFAIEFNYDNSSDMYIDDIELYEAEIFDNPLTIVNTVCKDSDNNVFDYKTGFTKPGTITHTTTLYNEDEDDVNFKAIMVLYVDDMLYDMEVKEECALVLDETEVEFSIDIPNLPEYKISDMKYMVYFISDSSITQYYGQMPFIENPYIVQGQ